MIVTTALRLLAAGTLALALGVSHAAGRAWTGASSNLWSNPANWNPPGVPANGDDLIFGPGAANLASNNDIAGLSIARVTFSQSGYSLGGNGIVLTGGITCDGGAGNIESTIGFPVDIQGNNVFVTSDSFAPTGCIVRMAGGLAGTGLIGSTNFAIVSVGAPSTYSGQFMLGGCQSQLQRCGRLRLEGVSMPLAPITGTGDIGAQVDHLFGNGSMGSVSNVAVSPGSSNGSFGVNNGTGIIATKDLRFERNDFWVDLEGPSPGTGYDQIVVTGTVSIGSGRLNLRIAPGLTPPPGQAFKLIDNDGTTDAILGTFPGLPEGSTLAVSGYEFLVSYRGGDGNDLTLTVTLAPKTWTGAGNTQAWSNPGNWMNSALPQAGDRIFFPAGAANLSNINDLSGLVLHSIMFDAGGYTLFGNPIVVTKSISATPGVGANTNPGVGGNTITMPVDVQTNSVSIMPSGDLAGLRLTGGLAGSGPITVDRSFLSIGGTASYTGTITLTCANPPSCGGLHLENASMPSATVTSAADRPYFALSGIGVVGSVSDVNVEPGIFGFGTGILSTGNLSFGGQAFNVNLAGGSPGTGYDQVSVTGTVTLANARFAVVQMDPSTPPVVGQVFTIIANDGSDPVNGRFDRFPQGIAFGSYAGLQLRLSYAGGDGNDVTLTAISGSPRLANIATRGPVLTGDDVMIGGFVIGGSSPKNVMVRARGPSLAQHGVPGVLADPVLRLFSGQTQIAANDNWQEAPNLAQVQASDLAPPDPRESAILTTLQPGAYTAIVSGAGATTGVGIVEVFEADQPEVPLVNIATRGQVLTGNNVMIAGFVIQGTSAQTVVVRARGPSLGTGVPNVLTNPVLSLFSGQTVIASNDDWQTAANAATLQSSGFAPADSREAAIYITLPPGAYTAIVTGAGGTTGVGIVEVFAVP